MRRLALPGHQRRLRDHGRRGRGDQGAGHRPVRQAIPRGRVRRPRLRLPPPRGERGAAAPGVPRQGSARRLAGGDRLRRDPARSRPGQARDLGLLPVRRSRLAGRGAQPAARRGDRADAERRRPGRHAQRRASPEAARDAAFHRPGPARCRRRPRRPPAAAGAAGRCSRERVALLTTPDSVDGDRALNPGNRYPGLAAGGRRPLRARAWLSTGRAATPPGYGARCSSWCATRIRQRLPDRPSPRRGARPARRLVRLPGSHYAPFMDAHEQAVDAELSFLRRHLLDRSAAESPAVGTADSALL